MEDLETEEWREGGRDMKWGSIGVKRREGAGSNWEEIIQKWKIPLFVFFHAEICNTCDISCCIYSILELMHVLEYRVHHIF